MDSFTVKIPGGYLVVEAKGTEDEYPGVWISFSKTGEIPCYQDMIACVEYVTPDKEIRTECYAKDFDEPCAIIRFDDGNDML